MGILGAVVFVFVLFCFCFCFAFTFAVDCLFALRPMIQKHRIPQTK
jgi:hypothetical protein